MTCADFRHAIVDLARGTLPDADEPRVRAHVAECPACAVQLATERSLSAALRGLAEDVAAEGAPDAVEERLLSMFEADRTTTPSRAAVPFRWWIPLAACLVLAAGSIAWWRSGEPGRRETGPAPSTPASARVSGAAPSATVPSATTVSTPANVDAHAVDPGPPNRASKIPARRPPRVLRPAGFMAIPAATGLPDFESGEIVRTRIPVSSLPVYGVDIPPDAAGTLVEADLLVGQDGRARAIRLVTRDSRNTRSRQ
jgi:anti-sigma factor RsiW